MKYKTLTLIMLLFMVSVSLCFAESFDGIYKKNLLARGGNESVKSAKTFIIEGELIREDSIRFNFRAAYKLPNNIIVEYYQEGDTSALGFDGKTAWTIMPALSSNVIELPPTAAEEAINLTVKPIVEFYNRLDYYKSIKAKVAVSDKDTLDTIPQFKLICPNKTGEAEVILVNQNDFLISQINSSYRVGGATVPAAIRIDNYRLADESGSLNVPHHIKIFNGENSIAEINVTLFELNPKLDDVIFELPK